MTRLLLFILLPCLTAFAEVREGVGLQKDDLVVSAKGRTATMNYYRFSSSKVSLKVIPKGKFSNLSKAMQGHQCLAGCNGGFFDPEYKPLGQVIADGKKSGTRNLASSLTSGVIYQTNKTLAIERAKTFYAKSLTPDQLLQIGPFLVENGKAVSGLSGRKVARRTFIATDGKGEWLIAVAPPTSLAQLAKSLSEAGNRYGFKIKTALNLDGGSSSALWVSKGAQKSPYYLREFKQVSNYIGLVAKVECSRPTMRKNSFVSSFLQTKVTPWQVHSPFSNSVLPRKMLRSPF